jgi:hypothetical protein
MSTRTEQTMRDSKAPWPKSTDELRAYIDELTGGSHDYGTCVYAMSLAAHAAFNYVASKLGVTGFQASCADMDFLERTRGYKHGFAIIDYGKLLYPQTWTEEHFPRPEQILAKQAAHLRPVVYALLNDSPAAHPNVRAHWETIGRWMTQYESALASRAAGVPNVELPAPLSNLMKQYAEQL